MSAFQGRPEIYKTEAFLEQEDYLADEDYQLSKLSQSLAERKRKLAHDKRHGYPPSEIDNSERGVRETEGQIKGRLMNLEHHQRELHRFRDEGTHNFLTDRERTRFYNNRTKVSRMLSEYGDLVSYICVGRTGYPRASSY